ncbi:T-cell receptor gamma chain V region V108A [Anser cygnoides]|uniref:T-cell receptor gamma chain V region V108A n=1 Tax=Anser cygnoides TaxID=8845 RepID=UPI0034D1C1A0
MEALRRAATTWLLRAFVLAAAFSCGPARALQQSPVSITKPESKTVLITCHVSVPDFDKAFIHWYRKRPGAAPERVAYMASRLFLGNEADGGKFSIEKDLDKSVCTLTVSKVTLQDAATYYCARWDAQQQRAISSLHKDVLPFLDHTLKVPKTSRNVPALPPHQPRTHRAHFSGSRAPKALRGCRRQCRCSLWLVPAEKSFQFSNKKGFPQVWQEKERTGRRKTWLHI